MKGNNGTGNIAERDLWQTNKELFGKLNKQYNFTFDCCAEESNTKCETWSEDFLDDIDINNVMSWMNPPFSKAGAMFRHFFSEIKMGVCIYRCDNMETKIWQDIILKNATWVFIPKGRISYQSFEYKRNKGTGSRFPSALIGFNVEPPKDMEGVTLFIREVSNE